MDHNAYLLIFAAAFMGCVLATPMVTRVAAYLGAIDRPDQFRRIHRGAIPRLGGLAVAVGLALAVVPSAFGGHVWKSAAIWWSEQWAVLLAGLIVLVLGVIDDTRGVSPRPKLLVQALAVLVLVAGGIRIGDFRLLGVRIDVTSPMAFEVLGHRGVIDPLSTFVTLIWFLACMNIWNLIDGMDGLASGVGLLVSGTLMIVAMRVGSPESAALAAGLAGGLAGFLLYNWHPACIFLGDSGSLLIGLLIGVMGVQSSMKSTTAVSILFPILAMGLPISDTAMAIFRRWVRELPLSSADRRHIHHLLIGLGLNPRQAAALLYCFSGFLCGVVLLGVALNSVGGEYFALIVGASGCLAFLLILTSRRDELNSLMADLRHRMARKRQERQAAKLTWESIQQIELCPAAEAIWHVLLAVSHTLGCDHLRIACIRDGRELMKKASDDQIDGPLTGSVATFRLKSGEHLRLTVTLHHAAESDLAADIAFRSLQRLSLATAQRLERLVEAIEEEARCGMPREASLGLAPAPSGAVESADAAAGDGMRPSFGASAAPVPSGRDSFRWFRWTFHWGSDPWTAAVGWARSDTRGEA